VASFARYPFSAVTEVINSASDFKKLREAVHILYLHHQSFRDF
jgi:hypothetical protein